MTAVSLINPYAPQPIGGTSTDTYSTAQPMAPVSNAKPGGNAGLASDQSGQGAGNGTGTGGAQLTALLKKGRQNMSVQLPTPESIVEAQTDSDATSEFLARQEQLKAQAAAAEEQRIAERAAQRAADAEAEAAKAAEPEFVPPNPIPTAPILKENDV